MMEWQNFKKQSCFILITLLICNIIPTCAGYKSEITESYAMPATPDFPRILNFSPQVTSGRESIFVYVTGMGFERGSRLVINGFSVRGKYLRVVNSKSIVVKVPKGVPEGKYSVLIKNPDGKISNEVEFEVKG